ncbi:MAG: FAD-dependent oxidoreductase, partial [Kovacikia sp.]
AAGMAAALCVEQGCQPRNLQVRSLQDALVSDPIAPVAVIPLLNLPPNHPDWQYWQHYYLDHPEAYPQTGNCPAKNSLQADEKTEEIEKSHPNVSETRSERISGIFCRAADQTYTILIAEPKSFSGQSFSLVTLHPEIDEQLQTIAHGQAIQVAGHLNHAGNWVLASKITPG